MELLRAYVSPTTGVLLVTHYHRIIRASDRRIELQDGVIARDSGRAAAQEEGTA
jgi:ABC-type lipoprotein export system ATPase subunit